MSLSRAELQAMDRDELIDTIVELGAEVEDLRAEVDRQTKLRQDIEQETIPPIIRRLGDLEGRVDDLEAENEELRDTNQRLREQTDVLHHERSKLARRVTALEEELGVDPSNAITIAEAGQEDAQSYSKLALLLKHGPEAVSDRPTRKMRRARELLQNWERWGTIRNDANTDGAERRLAAKGHDLKTRLEDARGETLSWKQVYRAMELIDDWSGAEISLQEGSAAEGKYVLVHRSEEV